MATIIIDNTSSEAVTWRLINGLELNSVRNRIDPDESLATFIKAPLDTVGAMRAFVNDIENPAGQSEITSVSDNRVTLKTTLFSSENLDSEINLALNGKGFKDGANPSVTGISYTSKFIRYFDDNKSPNNIDVLAAGPGSSKVEFNWNHINTPNDPRGNVVLSSDILKDSGYFHDDQKVKFNYTFSQTLLGNVTITTDDGITGTINSLRNSFTEKNSTTSESVSMSLSSSLGIFVNEKQEYSGIINALSLMESVKKPANQWSGGISYKETLANNQLVSKLSQFIANQTDFNDLTAALFNQNDKITAKGTFTTINGYAGNDAITLGSGNDTVEFSTSLGTNNIDTIKGFKKAGNDKLKLSSAIFEGYSGGDNFVIGTAAADANDRIIYDNKSGKLFYDADGTGSVAAVQFATLVGKPSLSAADIYTF
jgi:Ca2+-binding RTX toxin-like protein